MRFLTVILFIILTSLPCFTQEHSVARTWNENLLQSIRQDLARPTVHARNLFHLSAAMYDCWAIFDPVAEPYLIGKSINDFSCDFDGFPIVGDPEAVKNEIISHAAYTLIRHRYRFSPGFFSIIPRLDNVMDSLGYDPSFTDTDYSDGNPATLGNYIAQCYIEYGIQDGSNELTDYTNLYYEPTNAPLIVSSPGNPMATNLNTWQPLTLSIFIDQSGNIIPGNTPPFLSPEWGAVEPFSMTLDDANVYERDDFEYIVYHDPGPPPLLDSIAESENYKWGFVMNILWSAHLDKDDETLWDISPGALGNLDTYPENIDDFPDYYRYFEGGVQTPGHELNPVTGQPYEPNIVKRGDYARVLAEFWADGPDSETPPGHWFTLLNYVMDHPDFERSYLGEVPIDTQLEYDVKAYFMMGGAMHDCAISAWGIKGYYDYLRPISAIRCMADNGQSSDPTLPNYSNLGLPLIPGYIESIEAGDPLVGFGGENIGKIKIMSWRGPDYIPFPEITQAGVDWILAEEWWPYQRPSFVTPNFAGYVSGHSTYSRAAAEIMTTLTGDPFFPGGVGEFLAPRNEFLVFEEGPSEDIVLQWATYRDASNQTSLSRIWGGIHPPADDLPGRTIGIKIAESVFIKANDIFYNDDDQDGYYNYFDCDDNNPMMNPGLSETCDDFDNDCNGIVNDGVPLNRYYFDTDLDGFGDASIPIDTCILVPPPGYVTESSDCNDLESEIYPGREEICDAIDNDCDGELNNGLTRYIYFRDFDGDGYGDRNNPLDTCIVNPPAGFVVDDTDCNDDAANIFPTAVDIPDNDIDEDCSGLDLFKDTKYLPTTFMSNGEMIVHYDFEGEVETRLYTMDGKLVAKGNSLVNENYFTYELQDLPAGIYVFRFYNVDADFEEIRKLIKVQ